MHGVLFVDVRMHSASWRVGDEPTAATLAQTMTETTVQDPKVKSRNRMLGDGSKGGYYRQNDDERMYIAVFGGVLSEEALHYL